MKPKHLVLDNSKRLCKIQNSFTVVISIEYLQKNQKSKYSLHLQMLNCGVGFKFYLNDVNT